MSLTKESLRAQHHHHLRNGIVEEGNSHGVSHGHFSRVIREECAVLEGSHGVEPWFACAVDEAPVNPARYLV